MPTWAASSCTSPALLTTPGRGTEECALTIHPHRGAEVKRQQWAALGLLCTGLASGTAWAQWPKTMDGFPALLQERLAPLERSLAGQGVVLAKACDPAEELERQAAALPKPAAEDLRQFCQLSSLKEAASKLKPTDPPPEAVMLKAARDAQAKVDKLRAKFQTAYERGDTGASVAIDLNDFSRVGTGADRATVSAEVRRWAQDAERLPRTFRKSLSAAQAEADKLVKAAITYLACEEPGRYACQQEPLVTGMIAKLAFDQHHDAADKADADLSTAAYGLAVIKQQPDIRPEQLPGAVAFRKLLDSNPDVKSYFGGDAVGITAGAQDSNLSFRYVWEGDGKWLGRLNRSSLVFSAPTNKDKSGVTRFADSTDALQNLASVKYGFQLTNMPFRFPAIGTLNDFGFSVAAAQDTRSHYLSDPATPVQVTKVEKSYVVVSLGVKWVFLANPTSDYKTLLVFGQESQRRYKNSDVQTRCPVDPTGTAATLVGCYTGSWGAPKRTYGRLVSLEIRQHMPAFDVGLRIKQDLETDKVDAEVPFYLFRTNDGSAKKNPFAAGIVISRSSGEAGLKWGVFVSAPLQFLRPDR
ncbi:hypothetical protein [Rubrivivax rivuli]|uniref:Uncharacterized protein n=1 Tax=Rubrivivax rivuli TaxID=1862385 RepID=A0A437RKL5_9BURK|nr:hypothetical protein [Rubrivivax rivuli]RVU47202.1 hypothetical protein EOE66_05445 [Rubrivivax rivuli]